MGTHGVKIVVIYPRPQDEEAFEKVYLQEHVPLAEAKLQGRTRIVLTKVVSSPQGKVSAYRIAEVHFSSMDDLTKCVESEAGKQVLEHATKISTAPPPLRLLCQHKSFPFL